MQSLNRKEIVIKTLLILISILSIILIKEGIDDINHSIQIIKNMGGFEFYPINSPDTFVQGWYYNIMLSILLTLCPTIILILSVISMFVPNRLVEISIVDQTALMLILTLTANFNYGNFIENKIGYYPFLAITILFTLTITIISTINEKSLLIFYILELILCIVKYIDVYKFWYSSARGDISLLGWLDMYGIKYAIITILGFCILMLRLREKSNKKTIKL